MALKLTLLLALAASMLGAAGGSLRGAAETKRGEDAASPSEDSASAVEVRLTPAIVAAEYPMKEVPVNPNTNTAMYSLVAAIVVPAFAILAMLWAKEKGWWGACSLMCMLLTGLWVYCAVLGLM